MKNVVVVLIACTVAFGGYYYYTQSSATVDGGGAVLSDEMLLSTQLFIERRATLDRVRLDTTLFDDSVFRSYRTFREPINEEPYGRTNPFSRTIPGAEVLNF